MGNSCAHFDQRTPSCKPAHGAHEGSETRLNFLISSLSISCSSVPEVGPNDFRLRVFIRRRVFLSSWHEWWFVSGDVFLPRRVVSIARSVAKNVGSQRDWPLAVT